MVWRSQTTRDSMQPQPRPGAERCCLSGSCPSSARPSLAPRPGQGTTCAPATYICSTRTRNSRGSLFGGEDAVAITRKRVGVVDAFASWRAHLEDGSVVFKDSMPGGHQDSAVRAFGHLIDRRIHHASAFAPLRGVSSSTTP